MTLDAVNISQVPRASLQALDQFCRAVLLAAGTDQETADAATRALMHGTRTGVDSHGIRLLDHYVRALRGGRINGHPTLKFFNRFPALAVLDADHAQGARAGYAAMERAVFLAETNGIGAVAVHNSSHFGPAGAYALAAAQAGMIGLAFCNSDSFVRLHDGAERFHGTNPIAMAAPSRDDQEPWLLDMATSAVPFNRVQLYKSLGLELPDGVASDGTGVNVHDPEMAEMLAPLGHAFGFKGAGLAGLVELLSAVLTGMTLSFDILPMPGPDMSTPRHMGAFFIAIRADAAVDRDVYDTGIRRYLDTLRASAARNGAKVMAPGDREWSAAGERAVNGVSIDPATAAAFAAMSVEFALDLPWDVNT